ncbi:MAG: hypothetical protein ACRDGM_08460 [bacterium]
MCFIFVAAATLLVAGLAAAQTSPQIQIDPRFQKQLEQERLLNPPTAPIFVSPDDNAVRMPGLNTNDPLTFSWRTTDPVVGNDAYKLRLCYHDADGKQICNWLFQGGGTLHYAPPGGDCLP